MQSKPTRGNGRLHGALCVTQATLPKGFHLTIVIDPNGVLGSMLYLYQGKDVVLKFPWTTKNLAEMLIEAGDFAERISAGEGGAM